MGVPQYQNNQHKYLLCVLGNITSISSVYVKFVRDALILFSTEKTLKCCH